jgi:hypothetical protein
MRGAIWLGSCVQQVRRTGACRHPVRLRGVVLRGDEPVYSTASEPDGARCGNRQEACYPSCAHEYRGDMWQLVYAGMAGGAQRRARAGRRASAGLRQPHGPVVRSRPQPAR